MADLHIISFTIPYPPDYGGAIDVYEKVRALHAEGVRVHLHCFQYDRGEAPELEAYCASVRYYRRKGYFPSLMPYIVASRASRELLRVLEGDDYPILSEGIHTSWVAMQWPGRVCAVRLHNVEAEYYAGLAGSALQRIYYQVESRLLARWEKRVAALKLLAIHPAVAAYFRERYGSASVAYLPAFTSYEAGHNPTGRGEFVLFHGDLSVTDNVEALRWLLENVRSGEAPGIGRLDRLPWVVAGRKPGARARRLLWNHPDVVLEADPSGERMEALIRDAQVHVVHSFNPEGIKIKLLHALFAGRHCIASASLLEGTGLEETCHAAEDAGAFRTHLDALWGRPFTEEDRATRTRVLQAQFDNRANARKLISLLTS